LEALRSFITVMIMVKKYIVQLKLCMIRGAHCTVIIRPVRESLQV